LALGIELFTLSFSLSWDIRNLLIWWSETLCWIERVPVVLGVPETYAYKELLVSLGLFTAGQYLDISLCDKLYRNVK
jgi:hypothetical protein